MANVAPEEVEADTPEQALYRRLNFFPTPPWGSRVGAELVSRIDPWATKVCDPCAGMGHMADALAESFETVEAFDLHGYGRGYPLRDWTDDRLNWPEIDWMIANPPFNKAEEFVRLGLQRARRGVAVLCRLSFMETVGRYQLMRQMQIYAPFCERLPMVLGRWDPKVGTATAHAWFVWAKPEARGIELPGHAFIEPVVRLIPPGTKARLWRATDPAIYGELSPAPIELQGTISGSLDLEGIGA